jgi:hypothetical protein
MLFVRGFALLLLFAIAVIATDGIVPDRDVAARMEARSALVTVVSEELASASQEGCGGAPVAECAKMAALPRITP